MVTIIVSTEIDGEYRDVGDLMYDAGRNGIASGSVFTYDRDWVLDGYDVDPSMRVSSARIPVRWGMPSAFRDASPDAWGSLLLTRRERERAARDGRPSRKLDDAMLLLGASDAARQGALRFRVEQDGPFLGQDTDIPQQVELEDLFAAASEVSADPHTKDWAAIERLLGTGGTALGGARPKASFEREGHLWIAKFPRAGDTTNVPVWEMVGLDIAEDAGLAVPTRELINIGGREVLLIKRFDRDGVRRIPYISTRTLLQKTNKEATADYLEIAERLRRVSSRASHDLHQLWRQAAVNVAVNNTDNHLLNHGLVRAFGGWVLAPSFDYDLNPDGGTHFTTSIGGGSYRSTAVSRGLWALAKACGIREPDARDEFVHISTLAVTAPERAAGLGLSDNEIDTFAAVFTPIASRP